MNFNFFSRFRKPHVDVDSNLEARRDAQIAADTMAHGERTVEAIALPASDASERIHQRFEEPNEAVPVITDDADIEKEREFYLSHPREFGNEVLGFELAPEHEILLDALLDDNSLDILVLWPRGSAKSTCIVVAAIISIVRKADIRIFYGTSADDLAMRRGAQIKDFFDHPTPKFQKLFPEFCGVRSRSGEFTVPSRTDRTLADPTFTTAPLGADATGSHFDLIFIDDLVTKKNSETPEQRQKMFERYQGFRGLRTARTRLVISGTIYDADDPHSRILRAIDAEGESCQWRLDRRSVYQPLCKNCGHKKLFHYASRCRLCAHAGSSCPCFQVGELAVLVDKHRTRSGEYGWTLEELAREQSESRMGKKFFRAQYEMDVSPESEFQQIKFSPEFLREHTLGSMLSYRPHLIVGDLGLTASPNANFSVLLALVVFDGCLYPIDAAWGQWDAAAARDNIIRFMDHHGWCPAYFERIGAFDSIKLNIQERACAVKCLDIRGIPVDNSEDAKLKRIGSLHEAIAAGRVGLYANMPGYQFLVGQLRQFPHIRPVDDFADTLALALVVAETMPPANMPPIFGRQPAVETQAPTIQVLDPAEKAILEAPPIVGIHWIDSLPADRREFLRLSAKTYDTVFVTNNQACALMAWNCCQPAVGIRKWYDEYAAHPAIAAASKIFVVPPVANQEQNRRFLESLARSPIRDRCLVVTRPIIPDMFKYRLGLQREFGQSADSMFERSYGCEPLAVILNRAA